MKKIMRKSLLYKSGVEYADFSLNHVEGCAHGCMYPCYAFNMAKRFGRVSSYKEWITPKLVGNALEILDKEIPKYKKEIKFVHLCFMTDPFMFKFKEVGDMTLQIIKKLSRNNIRCTVLTKGILPKALTNTDRYGENNDYGITLVSSNERFRKTYEPNSAHFEKRIDALKYLHDKGLKTWVSMEPYPTPNIVEQDLLPLLKQVSFVDKIVFGKLNYNVKVRESEGNKEFYENCAHFVVDFCKKYKIDYHIKYGTQEKDNRKTEIIFRKPKILNDFAIQNRRIECLQ